MVGNHFVMTAIALTFDMVLNFRMAEEVDIGQWYKEHGAFVARVIERLTGGGPHVDDLLQETFIAAFKARDRYDPARSLATTWLYAIATHLCKRHGRSQWRFSRLQNKLLREDLSPISIEPDHHLDRKKEILLVHEVLGKLPFKQREVFALYELENMDGSAIAELLEIPEGTVWTRLHHARKSFKTYMKRRLLTEDFAHEA